MKLLLKKTEAIKASIDIPGSKSFTNRALIAAVLSNGTSTLRHVSLSDDSTTLIQCLKQLGADITQTHDTVVVKGWGDNLSSVKTKLEVGPAGTTTRFLTALAAVLPRSNIEIHGNERMNQRPIGPLVEGLRGLGITIEHLQNQGSTPLRITTGPPSPTKDLFIDGSASSQYVTAMLLIAPALKSEVRLHISGSHTSASYIDMSLAVLRDFGVRVERTSDETITIMSGYGSGTEYTIEADASGAVNFLSLGALGGGPMTIRNLSSSSQQGDMQFLRMLKDMGCVIGEGNSVSVKAERQLGGVEVDMNLLPDSAMALAVVAGFASTPSHIRGLSTLKHKETDRLQALQNELAKLKIETKIDEHSIRITPQTNAPNETPVIATYDDHRIAMAFAIAATKTDIIVEDAEVVSKSFPNFWDVLRECGVQIEELDG